MKGCILKLMLIMSLVTTSIELNAQQIMVRILDTTYIPSIIEDNESRQSITLSCKNKNFNEILSTFVFKDFEQTFLELKNSKWEQEDIDWFLQVYTFYFLSYDDRDRFLSFLEEYKNIFEGPSVAEAHYRIAANTSTTFNDRYSKRRARLFRLHSLS